MERNETGRKDLVEAIKDLIGDFVVSGSEAGEVRCYGLGEELEAKGVELQMPVIRTVKYGRKVHGDLLGGEHEESLKFVDYRPLERRLYRAMDRAERFSGYDGCRLPRLELYDRAKVVSLIESPDEGYELVLGVVAPSERMAGVASRPQNGLDARVWDKTVGRVIPVAEGKEVLTYGIVGLLDTDEWKSEDRSIEERRDLKEFSKRVSERLNETKKNIYI